MYAEGAIAREELDEIAFNRKALKERLANAKSNLDELQNGSRVEQIRAQQAAVRQLSAEIKDLDITIDKSILNSPFDAIVSALKPSLNLLSNQNGSSDEVQNVPLSSLGKITLEPELAKITRYNGQRVNTIQGFLTPGVSPDKALTDFKQQLTEANWQLPNGYSYEFGGEAEEKNDALGGLVSTVGVLIVLMIATLVLSLGSFRLAAFIGVVAIASFGLGLFSIWLFGYPFGFNPIIGKVGLIGVAINDSIVVLAAIQQHPLAKTGNKPAIREVVLHSTRHVIATTLTTAIGFVPLLLGGGEFWPPLAVAIANGVIGATLLALYLIPATYLNCYRRQK